MAEDGRGGNTSRHAFTLDKNGNKHFELKSNSQHLYNVMLFGDAAFNKFLGSIPGPRFALYQGVRIRVSYWRPRTKQRAPEGPGRVGREAMEQLNTIYQVVFTRWPYLKAAFWTIPSSLLPSTRVIPRTAPSSRSALPRSTQFQRQCHRLSNRI